jgi:hypothetical protein
MLRQDRFSLNRADNHRLINRTPTASTVRQITLHILSDLKLSKVKLNIWGSRLVRAK